MNRVIIEECDWRFDRAYAKTCRKFYEILMQDFGPIVLDNIANLIVTVSIIVSWIALSIHILEPLYSACFGYFEVISIMDYFSIVTLLFFIGSWITCDYFDKDQNRTVVVMHALHIAGIIGIPLFGISWAFCVKDIPISRGNVFTGKPPISLSYGPLYYNRCIDNFTNCFSKYSFRHLNVIQIINGVIVFYSIHLFVFRVWAEKDSAFLYLARRRRYEPMEFPDSSVYGSETTYYTPAHGVSGVNYKPGGSASGAAGSDSSSVGSTRDVTVPRMDLGGNQDCYFQLHSLMYSAQNEEAEDEQEEKVTEEKEQKQEDTEKQTEHEKQEEKAKEGEKNEKEEKENH